MGQELKRIVVTGIGVLSPIGLNKEEFWDSLYQGKSGAAPITYFNAADFATTFACELKGFSAENYIDRKSADRMDPYCQYAVIAAAQALTDSGLELKEIDPLRIGVVHGSGIGGMTTYDKQFRNYLERGPRRISPFFIPMLIPDIAAGQISIDTDLWVRTMLRLPPVRHRCTPSLTPICSFRLEWQTIWSPVDQKRRSHS